MKKSIPAVFVAAILLSLIGCGPFEKIDGSLKIDTGLRQVVVDTQGNSIKSKETYEEILVGLYEPNGEENILGDSSDLSEGEAKARGNTTKHYPKKPYTLKVPKTKANKLFSSLTVGSSASTKVKKVALIANFIDPSMLKNDIAFALSGDLMADGHQMFPMEWTVNREFVDLIWNGTYNGTYLLTDHTQNISKYLEFSLDAEADDMGFFVELDDYYDEEPKFRTESFDMPVMVKYPDWDDDITYGSGVSTDEDKQEAYRNEIVPNNVKAVLDEKEDILLHGTWSEVQAAFDVDSFLYYWFINAIMENGDAFLPRSVYLYQKNNSTDTLHAGPVWDFDYQTLSNTNMTIYTSWYYDAFFQRPEFVEMLKNAWAQLRNEGYITDTGITTAVSGDGYQFVEYIEDYIDGKVEEIRISWNLNATIWDVNTFFGNEQFQTFDGNIYAMKEALEKRAVQMDEFIQSL